MVEFDLKVNRTDTNQTREEEQKQGYSGQIWAPAWVRRVVTKG